MRGDSKQENGYSFTSPQNVEFCLSFLHLASVFENGHTSTKQALERKENWTWPLCLSIFQLVSLQQLETRALCFSRAHEEPITLKLASWNWTWTETANKVHKRQDLQRVKCLGKLSKRLMTLSSKFQQKQRFKHSKIPKNELLLT